MVLRMNRQKEERMSSEYSPGKSGFLIVLCGILKRMVYERVPNLENLITCLI